MNKDATYLLIDSKVVPEIFIKVLEVKRLLSEAPPFSQ
jgi:ACT domain-containing protein